MSARATHASAIGPWRTALVALLVTTPGPAAAQGNYEAAPIGGRTTLMGGTGIALGGDGASPFMNPATIARIQDRSLAFSSRILRYEERKFFNLHQPGDVDAAQFGDLQLSDTSTTSRSLRLLPNSTCLFFDPTGLPTKRLLDHMAGRQKLAVCLGKTEESKLSFTGRSVSGASTSRLVNQSQTIEHEWMNWGIGPSWSIYLSDDVAVGASLFASRTKHKESVTALTLAGSDTGGSTLRTDYQFASEGNSWDLVAHLGATARLSPTFVVGASVRAPGIHLYDKYRATYFRGYDEGSLTGSWWGVEGSFVVERPTRFSVGVGAEWKQLRLELDAFYYTGQDEYARATGERDVTQVTAGVVTSRGTETMTLTERSNPVTNLAFGAEWFVAGDLSLVGGVITDFSSLPELDDRPSDPRLFRSRSDAIHGSLGVVSYGAAGDLLVGVRLDHAKGQAAVVNPFQLPPRLERVDYRQVGVMLILAGRVSLTNVVEAARSIGDAVEGESSEPPEHPLRPLRKPDDE